MKKDFDIYPIVILYFILSIIYQVFFINPICNSIPGSSFWGCYYYIVERLPILLFGYYVLYTTSKTLNMVSAYSIIFYNIGKIVYFSILFFKPESYIDWLGSKHTGLITSLILWTLALLISIFKYLK